MDTSNAVLRMFKLIKSHSIHVQRAHSNRKVFVSTSHAQYAPGSVCKSRHLRGNSIRCDPGFVSQSV